MTTDPLTLRIWIWNEYRLCIPKDFFLGVKWHVAVVDVANAVAWNSLLLFVCSFAAGDCSTCWLFCIGFMLTSLHAKFILSFSPPTTKNTLKFHTFFVIMFCHCYTTTQLFSFFLYNLYFFGITQRLTCMSCALRDAATTSSLKIYTFLFRLLYSTKKNIVLF